MVQVTGMARHALWSDGVEWPTEREDAATLDVWALAWRVSGVAPGIYRYEPTDDSLRFDRPAPAAPDRLRLLLQPEFAHAPLQLWITGNLAGACAAAHRMWFTGIAMGLQGAIVAGIATEAARTELGFDGYRQAALVAVVAGV